MSWIKKFFWDGFYEKTYAWQMTPERTRAEVEAVIRLLALQPGEHVLDWCGGQGRHSVELARRGFQVTLLDYTPLHLEIAEQVARDAGVKVKLIQADFRETPPGIKATAFINMFTAGVGYYGDPQEDLRAFRTLHSTLAPEARGLVDTMSLYWLARNFNPQGWHGSADGKFRVLESREFDFLKGINHARQIFQIVGQGESENSHELKVYTPHELAAVMAQAGFSNFELYGSFEIDPKTVVEGHPEKARPYKFDFSSRRLILTAMRQ
jgi:D-alanine-D-alanine ligase